MKIGEFTKIHSFPSVFMGAWLKSSQTVLKIHLKFHEMNEIEPFEHGTTESPVFMDAHRSFVHFSCVLHSLLRGGAMDSTKPHIRSPNAIEQRININTICKY